MGTLGKVLILLNLAAAGAFAYLTLENWKVRQDLSLSAFQHQVLLSGIPVEAIGEPTGDEVPFSMTTSSGNFTEKIKKSVLEKLIPNGGEEFGGEATYSQVKELERVKAKVLAAVTALEGPAKSAKLRTLLMNLARTGKDRDAVIALFDMVDAGRIPYARRDLPYASSSTSQEAALATLVDIIELGDPAAITPAETRASRIESVRNSVKRFADSERAHAGGDQQAKDSPGGASIGELEANTFDTPAKVTEAIDSVTKFVTARAKSPAESAALTEIVGLMSVRNGAASTAAIAKAAESRLTQIFEHALLPAASKEKPGTYGPPEKARRIAHILYHLDADKYRTPAARKAWHERVVAIIGLPEYTRVAEAQAAEFSVAAQRLVAVITQEQTGFEEEYQAKVQRANFLFSQYLVLETQLKTQQEILNANTALNAQRETERDNLRTELAKAQDDAKVALENLLKSQQSLFNIQRQLRDAKDELFVLEKELRRLEETGR